MSTFSRRSALQLFGGAAAAGMVLNPVSATAASEDWSALAGQVRQDFLWAWGQYVEHAFGADQIKPISGGVEDFYASGHPVGLSLVEAVDTLWLMGADAEVERAVEWIAKHLRFDIDASFSTFETNIRMVGGLAAAYHCTGDQRLLHRAEDLVERLLPAFTNSPTGLPYSSVNLSTGAVSGAETNLVEVGNYVTEFGALAQWTGRNQPVDLAKRAMRVVYEQRTELDLLPTELHAENGRWLNRTASIGPPADSFYETLWDAWVFLGDAELHGWYETLTRAITTHQVERTGAGAVWFPQVDAFTGEVVDRGQSVLASFYPGLLAESGRAQLGREYHDSWNTAQEKFGVLPETLDYASMTARDANNPLRPEFVDSALVLWLTTGDDVFRHRAATHYRAMRRTSKAPHGFAGLADVTTRPQPQDDSCPGYWWSEQMKYYWLLFSDTDRFDYADNVLTTEANLLRGARR